MAGTYNVAVIVEPRVLADMTFVSAFPPGLATGMTQSGLTVYIAEIA
jgi:hypothetical protein